jgi:hypothetical protein
LDKKIVKWFDKELSKYGIKRGWLANGK